MTDALHVEGWLIADLFRNGRKPKGAVLRKVIFLIVRGA
jgi:hypothetical protein